jgi:group I intron endonuclease
MEQGIVYKLHCTKSGKEYVGQTVKALAKRMDGHRTAYRRTQKGCRALNAAIEKYGWDSFQVEELGRAKRGGELDALEERMIEFHDTVSPNGYNIMPSASVSPFAVPGVKERVAIINKTPLVRAKVSQGVKRARAMCTPQERAVWVQNVRKSQTTEEALANRAVKQKAARERKSAEELRAWNDLSKDKSKDQAARKREAKLATMDEASKEKYIKKLIAVTKHRAKKRALELGVDVEEFVASVLVQYESGAPDPQASSRSHPSASKDAGTVSTLYATEDDDSDGDLPADAPRSPRSAPGTGENLHALEEEWDQGQGSCGSS